MKVRSLRRSLDVQRPYFTGDLPICAGLETRYGLSVHRGLESPLSTPLSVFQSRLDAIAGTTARCKSGVLRRAFEETGAMTTMRLQCMVGSRPANGR
jgi:hypothetical protein